MIKAVVYGMREDEKDAFRKIGKEFPFELIYTEKYLTEETIALSKGAKAIIIVAACKITEELAKGLYENGVGYILCKSTGYEQVDKEAVKKYGIRVANVPVYSLNAVPEFTVMLILNLIRNFKKECMKLEKRDFTLTGIQGKELGSMTLGVFGTGLLGCQSIRMLKAFGCEILAFDPYPKEEAKKYVTYTSKDEIYKRADLIFFHCVLNQESKHMINKDSIALMKDGVYLVNTARGGLFHFADVLEGLKSGKIAGLATDVYDNEASFIRKQCEGITFEDSVLEELLNMDQVIFTPHIAFYSETAIYNMIKISLENLQEFVTAGNCSNEVYQ